MFGQFGHFHKYAPEKIPYAMERYKKETQRLLSVLDTRLQGRSYLVGNEYSIADMATAPWVICLDEFYEAKEILGLSEFENVTSWVNRVIARPKTAKGRKVCAV